MTTKPTPDPESAYIERTYIKLGQTLVQQSLEVLSAPDPEFAQSKVKRPRQCTKGLSCKNACVDPRKSCDVGLAGQAKTFAGWLWNQIKAGMSALKGGKKPKGTGEEDPRTPHGKLIQKGKAVVGEELIKKLDDAFKMPEGMAELKRKFDEADKEYTAELKRVDYDVDSLVDSPIARRFVEVADKVMELESAAEEKRQALMTQVRQKLLDTGLPRTEAQALAAKVGVSDDVIAAYGRRKDLDEELADYFQITKGAGAKSIRWLAKDDDRAYADPAAGEINIGSFASVEERRESLFHEAAHHAEANNESVRKAMVSWVQNRAESRKQVPINEILRQDLYREDETAYKDKYVNPYVGKTYPDSRGRDYFTEVLSVGTQHLVDAESMSKLYSLDPKHFWLTIGAHRND